MAANKGHRWRFRLPRDPDDFDDDNDLWEQEAPRRSRPPLEQRQERRRDVRRGDVRRGEARRAHDSREDRER